MTRPAARPAISRELYFSRVFQLTAFLLLTTLSASTGQRTMTIQLPEGWREVRAEEIAALRPDVARQNEFQRSVKETPYQNQPFS